MTKEEILINKIKRLKELKAEFDKAKVKARKLNEEGAEWKLWWEAHNYKTACMYRLLEVIDEIDI